MKIPLSLKLILLTVLGILTPLLVSLILNANLIIILAVGAISVFISSLLIFFSLKPLKNLVKSIEFITAGNLNHKIDIRSGDEFEIVANNFNAMVDKLATGYHKLEQDTQIAISEKSRLNEVLASIIDGVIAIDFNKNIIFVNKSAEEMTGYTQSQLQGQLIDKFIHIFDDSEELNPKTYCQPTFKRSVKLVGREGRQIKVNLMSGEAGEGVQTNLSCILILHDLSKEEDLERMKLDFVSMASHELRTPLTSIIGYLSVFVGENKGKLPKEEIDLVDRSLISAQQLLTLVQNLLNVNKIERDQMSVFAESIDYYPVVAKVKDDLLNQAALKNIILNLSIPSQPLPKVMADPLRIGEVVTNLTANAINYTPAGGRVEIKIEISPNEVTTTVSDTGVGIPAEAIPHLFSKFFRVSNQEQKASKGTGLGLYISKSIIEKLNGKIWAESEMGKGSKFSFTLPLAPITSGIVDNNQFVGQQIQAGTLNY